LGLFVYRTPQALFIHGSRRRFNRSEYSSRSKWAWCPFFISGLFVGEPDSFMATRDETIRKIVEPVIAALGFQLWGIEYMGQGRHTLLRVYIDKEGGINVDDCAEASRHISSILDVEDPISSEYTLEVSSPGLDRMLFTLDQMKKYVGATLKLRLSENYEGRRNYSGVLKEVVNDELVLVAGEDRYVFPYELVEKANVVAEIEIK
jgi:ribosome maturation factor RimP